MTGEEIRENINKNTELIESMLDPSSFILDEAILQLNKQNDFLRSICPHEFKNGFCIYCGEKEA